MKKIKSIIGIALFLAMVTISNAQTPTVQLPNLIGGQAVSYKGQTFFISQVTNSDGSIHFIVNALTSDGTNAIIAPATPQDAMNVASQWIQANNPSNIGYYGTNEIDARLGVAYIQNSGQAVAVLSVDKYGLFGWSNIGLGGGVLQGNNAGKSGTAGAYLEGVYRKPIGDVAWLGGVIGGYDNWNGKPFIGGKAGLEYRQNAHLGEFLDADYAFEDIHGDRGLLISSGINYSF
jgi:hypothetical protein